LEDVREGRTKEQTGVGMFAEVLRFVREGRRVEVGGEKEEEEEEDNDFVPTGIARKLVELKEESIKMREEIGWGGDLGVIDGEVDEEMWVPLSHEDAHIRILEESRKLRGAVNETVAQKRRLHG
jgi:hypothetical protein